MIIVSMVLTLFNADFAVCTATGSQQTPVSIYANGQYYLFWQDERFFATQFLYALYGARITTSGTLLDPGGKMLYCDSAAGYIDVAYSGSNFLVVFRDPNC